MSYKLNIGQWNSIFAIPKSVVDKHIKLVGDTQLKVLLWILRYSDKSFSVESISESLLMYPKDVKNALQYWIDSEILMDSNLEVKSNIEEKKCDEIKEKKKIISQLVQTDGEYISDRIGGCKDISFIIKEAEIILGDKFSRGVISVLVSFYDDYGLPADVIVMILQYAVRAEKSSVRYIEKLGVSWANEGINTIEKAEKRIKFLDNMNVTRERFEKIIDYKDYKFSLGDLKIVDKWFNDWNYDNDMIKEAYDRCIRIKGKFILRYMDGIIKSWKNGEIYNKEQLKSGSHVVRNNDYFDSNRSVSYNIDDYKNYCKSILLGDKKLGEK